MSFLQKITGLIAFIGLIPAADAVTARPSVMNTATAVSSTTGTVRRMPTMTSYLTGGSITGSTSGSTTGSTSSSSLLENKECIDTYTECIKGEEACGADFGECTTNVLFHAKMPQCISTLSQCASAGINSLFGTSNVGALTSVATTNSYGEVTKYSYPTDSSVLGQMITAAAIENKYDTSTCVKRYTSCLKKESVCGADFELCTTDKEFKKQRVLCDSTLARCQGDGITELFGSSSLTAAPTATSRVGEAIAEGAALAAVNAVSTCYKVVDQCILNACAANPYKCYENAEQKTIDIVDAINNGTPITQVAEMVDMSNPLTKSAVAAYVKNSCLDTIGSNKYCHATFLTDGIMPTASQLRDEDNQEEVYDAAYSARYNSAMKAKITDLVNKFDTKAKEKCIDTIKSCAMRTCGSGSGAACYSQVFGSKDKSINNDYTRDEIKIGCMSVVNTDANCQYAAQNPNSTGTYNYAFIKADAFDTLFPEYEEDGGADPIGVVAALNSALATNYSDAAIAQMKKRCQNVATSCVRSMCGNDFESCYRNRTDVYSDLTSTGNSAFDKSMNKVGGVLDYTVILGMCVDTVKNASVCEEHLAIESSKLRIKGKSSASSWGGATTVRSGWIDAGGTSKMTEEIEEVQKVDENGKDICTDSKGDEGICDTVGPNGAYDTPVMIAYTTYIESQAASTLFKDLIYDLEIEAQAKYNAALTREQNMCMSYNAGGIKGNRDLGSAYMWVKLKSNKVPANYATKGLTTGQFIASNDLYGSFCRARVSIQSNDKTIQDVISKGADWATAYFAVGDTFTCGSWIPQSALDAMAQAVGDKARDAKEEKQPKLAGWMAALGALGGGAGFAALGSSIADGKILTGLTGKTKKSQQLKSEQCDNAHKGYSALGTTSDLSTFSAYINSLTSLVTKNDENNGNITKVTEVNSAFNDFRTARSGIGTKTMDDCYLQENGYSFVRSTDMELVGKCCYGDYTAADCSGCDDANEKKSAAAAALRLKNADNCMSKFASSLESTTGKAANAHNELTKKVDALYEACVKLATPDDKDNKKRKAVTAVTSVVGAAGSAALLATMTKKIQDSKLDAAEQEAIQEFMDAVGSKITCYVGGDEAGTYGDTIELTLE